LNNFREASHVHGIILKTKMPRFTNTPVPVGGFWGVPIEKMLRAGVFVACRLAGAQPPTFAGQLGGLRGLSPRPQKTGDKLRTPVPPARQ